MIAFEAIKNEHHETTTTTSNRISFSGSVAGATAAPGAKGNDAGADASQGAAPDEVASLKAGFQHKDDTTQIDQTSHENALLAFKNGITIKADNTDNKNNVAPNQASGTGQSILDLGGLDIYSGGDVNAQAGRVISTKYVDSYSKTTKSNDLFVGVDADLHSSLMTTIKDSQAPIPEPTAAQIAKYKAQNPGKTDDEAKAALKEQYQQQKDQTIEGDAVANVFKGLGGVKAGFGFEGTSSTSSVTATSENISHISGANINITASQGNMTLAGVDFSATGQTYQQDTSNKFVDSNGNPKRGYKKDADGNIVTAQGKLVEDKNGYLLDANGNRLLQGGNINLQAAQGDIDIIAARTTLSASSSSTSYGANIGMGIDANPTEALLGEVPVVGDILGAAGGGAAGTRVGFHVGNDSAQSNSVSHIDSSLAASGTLTINSSKRNVDLTGVTAVGSDVQIGAGGDINSNAYQDSESHSSSSSYVGFSNSLSSGPPIGVKGSDKSGNSTQQAGNTIYALGSTTTDTKGQSQHVDGTLSMVSNSGNITMTGGDYYGDNANINATQGDVKFIAAKSTSHEESSSGGAQLSMGASASFAGFGGGVDYGSLDGGRADYTVPDALKNDIDKDHIGGSSSNSSASSGDTGASANKTQSVSAPSDSQMKKMAALQAAGFTDQLDPSNPSVTLANNAFASDGQNTTDSLRKAAVIAQKGAGSVNDHVPASANSGELIGAQAGIGIDINIEKSNATDYSNAQLNVGKKLTITAGKGNVDIGGVDIGNVDPSGQTHSGTQVNISAEEIDSTKYVNTYDSESHSDSAFIGMKAEGHSAIADAAAHATTHIINAVKGTDYSGKDGGGLSASAYAKGRFAAETTIETVDDAMNLVTGDLVGGSVTMNIGDTHTWNKSSSTQENTNTITGGNITLQSTKRDITLNGVNISAEDQVTLDSARDINVRAAKSTSTEQHDTASVNLSGGGGVGVNAVALATTGDVGPNASAGISASNTYGHSATTSYDNASISAGNKVTLKSKGDTNLIGANVDSKNVDLAIGGNLNIASLQDTKTSEDIDVNVSLSGGASISAYTIASPTATIGAGGGEHHDNYAMVTKQAGIKATNGISGNVAGDISLTGAHLEDQSGQSTLGVGGNVYATQLQDFRDKDGGTGGLNVTIGENSQKTGAGVQGTGFNFTTDQAIHYEATQNATIAGVNLQKTWTSTDANGNTVVNKDNTNVIRGLENVNTNAANETNITRNDQVQAFATGADPGALVNTLKPHNTPEKTPVEEQGQHTRPPAEHSYEPPITPNKPVPPEHPGVDVTPKPPPVPEPITPPGLTHTPPENPKPTPITPEVTHNEPAPPPTKPVVPEAPGLTHTPGETPAKPGNVEVNTNTDTKTIPPEKPQGPAELVIQKPKLPEKESSARVYVQQEAAKPIETLLNNVTNSVGTNDKSQANVDRVLAQKASDANPLKGVTSVDKLQEKINSPDISVADLKSIANTMGVTPRSSTAEGIRSELIASIPTGKTENQTKQRQANLVQALADAQPMTVRVEDPQNPGKYIQATVGDPNGPVPTLGSLSGKNVLVSPKEGGGLAHFADQVISYDINLDPNGSYVLSTTKMATNAIKPTVVGGGATNESGNTPAGTYYVLGNGQKAKAEAIDPSASNAMNKLSDPTNKVYYQDSEGNLFAMDRSIGKNGRDVGEVKVNNPTLITDPNTFKKLGLTPPAPKQGTEISTHDVTVSLPQTSADGVAFTNKIGNLDLSQFKSGDTVNVPLKDGSSLPATMGENGQLVFSKLSDTQKNQLHDLQIQQVDANGDTLRTATLNVTENGLQTNHVDNKLPQAGPATVTLGDNPSDQQYYLQGQAIDPKNPEQMQALHDALQNNPESVTLNANGVEYKVTGVNQVPGQDGKSTSYQPVLEPVKPSPDVPVTPAEMTHNVSIPLPTGGESQSYAIGGKKLDLSQMNSGYTVSLDNGLTAKVGTNQNGDKTLSFENLTPAQMNALNKVSIDQFNANGQHIATDVLSVAGAGTKQAGLTSDTTVHPPSADQAQTTMTGDHTASTYRINGQDVDTSTAEGRTALLNALKNNPDAVTLKAGDTEHKVTGVNQSPAQDGKSTSYQPVLEPVTPKPDGSVTITVVPDQSGKVANYTDKSGQPLTGPKTKAELDAIVTKDGETPTPTKIFTNEKGEQAILKLVPDPNDATKQIPKLEHYDPTPQVSDTPQGDGSHTITFKSDADGYHYGDTNGNNTVKLSSTEMSDYLGTGKTKTVDLLDKNGQVTGAKAELSFEKDPNDPNKIIVNSKLDAQGVELTTKKPTMPEGTVYTVTDGQGKPINDKSGSSSGLMAKIKGALTKGSNKQMSFSTEGMTKTQKAQLKAMLDKGQEVVVTRPNPDDPNGEPLKFSVQLSKDAKGKDVFKLIPKQAATPETPTAPVTPTPAPNSATPGPTTSNGNTPTLDVPVDRLALVKNAAPESVSSNENASTADTPVDQQVLVKENQYIQPPKATPPEHIPPAPTDSAAAAAFYNKLKTEPPPLDRVVINANDQKALDALKENPNVLQVTGDNGTILYTNYDKVVAGIPKNKAVFWSDASRTDPEKMAGQDVARQYAQNHNRASLEMMIDQSGIKVPNVADIPPPYPPLLETLKTLEPGSKEYQTAIKDAYKNASAIQTRQKAFEKVGKGEALSPAEQEAFKKGPPSAEEIQAMNAYQSAAKDPQYAKEKANVDAFWGGISEALAKSVKGNVYALLSKDVITRAQDPVKNPPEKDKSVFISREIEALKNNPEVNRIIASDPNTYEQFVLFDRTTELSQKRDTLEEQLKTTNDETQANKIKEEINQVEQKLQTLLETNVDFKRYAQQREFVIDEGNQLLPHTQAQERKEELVQKKLFLQKILNKLNARENTSTPQNSELKEKINRVLNVIDQKLQNPEKPVNSQSSQDIKNAGPESTHAATSLIDDTPLAHQTLADNETSQKEIANNPCPLCFAAGTLVSTPQGYRTIDKLKVGDIIWSKRENNIGAPFAARILKTHVRHDQPIYRLTIRQEYKTGPPQQETLLVTPSHPFYVIGKGFIPVIQLKPGDQLSARADNKKLHVVSLTFVKPQDTTYNLTVETGHTFFVGHFESWVHNEGGPCRTSSSNSQQENEKLLQRRQAIDDRLNKIGDYGVEADNLNFERDQIEQRLQEINRPVPGPDAQKNVAKQPVPKTPLQKAARLKTIPEDIPEVISADKDKANPEKQPPADIKYPLGLSKQDIKQLAKTLEKIPGDASYSRTKDVIKQLSFLEKTEPDAQGFKQWLYSGPNPAYKGVLGVYREGEKPFALDLTSATPLPGPTGFKQVDYAGLNPNYQGNTYYYREKDGSLFYLNKTVDRVDPGKAPAGSSKTLGFLNKDYAGLVPNKGHDFSRDATIDNTDITKLKLKTVVSNTVISDKLTIAPNAGVELVNKDRTAKKPIDTKAFLNAASDLDTLHQNNIYLADIKPENMAFNEQKNQINFIDLDNRLSPKTKDPQWWGGDAFIFNSRVNEGLLQQQKTSRTK